MASALKMIDIDKQSNNRTNNHIDDNHKWSNNRTNNHIDRHNRTNNHIDNNKNTIIQLETFGNGRM